MIKSLFSLDGDIILYEGLSNPAENWNGWAIPFFTMDVAFQILEDCKEWFTYTFDGDKFSVFDNPELTDTDGSPMVCPSIEIEGIKYYSIGGRSWCWINETDEN